MSYSSSRMPTEAEKEEKAARERDRYVRGLGPEVDTKPSPFTPKKYYHEINRSGYTLEQLQLGGASGRKATFFVVDCRPEMFESCIAAEDEEDLEYKRTPFYVAVDNIWRTMNAIALGANQNHFVEVIFINTKDDNPYKDSDYSHPAFTTTIIPLKLIEVNDVMTVRKFIRLENQPDKYMLSSQMQIEKVTEFCKGIGGCCDLGDLTFHLLRESIWGAGGKLQRNRCATHFFSHKKDITKGDNAMMSNIKTVMVDIVDNGLRVQWYPLGPLDEEMDESWQELEPTLSEEQVSEALEQLTVEWQHPVKDIGRRVISSLKFHMSKKMAISVGIYGLYVKHPAPSSVKVDASTNEELKVHTKYNPLPFPTQTPSTSGGPPIIEGTLLEKVAAETAWYQNIMQQRSVCEANVWLDKKDVAELKRLAEPGLVLMGFKPMDSLKWTDLCMGSKFVYPLNEVTSGSMKFYNGLLAQCVEQNKFILVRYTLKSNTYSKIAAMVPHGPSLGIVVDEEDPALYEGFHLLELPFLDDKRDLDKWVTEDIQDIKVPDKELDAMTDFISKLKVTYAPTSFVNPTLERHYKHVETMATETEQQELDDLSQQMKPYYELPEIVQEVQAVKNKFIDSIFPVKAAIPERMSKRTASTSTNTPSPKLAKATGSATGKPTIVLQTEFANEAAFVEYATELNKINQLAKMTRDVLFKGLELVGAKYSKSMKKDALIDALKKHLRFD